jgi:peroxin-6
VPKRGNSSDGNAVMDRIVAELLMQIDMASDNRVFVIGATNRPDLLDPSILRAGRFDKQIYLGISKKKEDRVKILKAQTRNSRLQENFNFELIVDNVPENFTGADFYGLTSKAMMRAV